MVNAVFTTSESSAYDDLPEERYQFPKTYLRQAESAVGDWVVYYEPRRTQGPGSSGGRQAYFAMARLEKIIQDRQRPNHYYAFLSNYLEFDHAVPFRDGEHYYESALKKEDGKTNKGAFGRSVRALPANEFSMIVQAGFSRTLEPWETDSKLAQELPTYFERPLVKQIVQRRFRDEAFRRHVRQAYQNTCAVSGLRLINGGGRPEVQAAHIRSVEHNGPDTVRNGIALTATVHWLFDRGLISFEDNYQIIRSPAGLPEDLERLLPASGRLSVPQKPELRPHPYYLRWHREHCFKQ